jgi:transposase InsO family protein
VNMISTWVEVSSSSRRFGRLNAILRGWTNYFRQGVILHSDSGCQYTSGDFAKLARANGVVLSVGRKGECWLR